MDVFPHPNSGRGDSPFFMLYGDVPPSGGAFSARLVYWWGVVELFLGRIDGSSICIRYGYGCMSRVRYNDDSFEREKKTSQKKVCVCVCVCVGGGHQWRIQDWEIGWAMPERRGKGIRVRKALVRKLVVIRKCLQCYTTL